MSENELQKKQSVLVCPRCSLVNALDNKYCSKCSYPLVPRAFDEIKEDENRKIQEIEEKYKHDMEAMREEMENKFQQVLTRIDASKLI